MRLCPLHVSAFLVAVRAGVGTHAAFLFLVLLEVLARNFNSFAIFRDALVRAQEQLLGASRVVVLQVAKFSSPAACAAILGTGIAASH